MTIRKTLAEHIADALLAWAKLILSGVEDTQDGRKFREDLAQRMECMHERMSFEARVEQRRGGRLDPRSGYVIVWLDLSDHGGPARVELCRPRFRALLDQQGNPVDAKTSVKDLLDQSPDAVPDSPAELLDQPRLPSAGDGPLTSPEALLYLRLAIAALTATPGADGVRSEQDWACCAGRGDRELSFEHEQAHTFVHSLPRDAVYWAAARAELLSTYRTLAAQR